MAHLGYEAKLVQTLKEKDLLEVFIEEAKLYKTSVYIYNKWNIIKIHTDFSVTIYNYDDYLYSLNLIYGL